MSTYQLMLECAAACRLLQCVVFRKQKYAMNWKHEYLDVFRQVFPNYLINIKSYR